MLLSCFSHRSAGEARDTDPLSHGWEQRIVLRRPVHASRSKRSFDALLFSSKHEMVVVNWSAKWCSLSVQADNLFDKVAKLHRTPGCSIRFVSVNLDKAEELAVEHKITMLPAFSIFVEGQRLEHYVGLESCHILSNRLQPQAGSDMERAGQEFQDVLASMTTCCETSTATSTPSSSSMTCTSFCEPEFPSNPSTQRQPLSTSGRNNYLSRFVKRKQTLTPAQLAVL